MKKLLIIFLIILTSCVNAQKEVSNNLAPETQEVNSINNYEVKGYPTNSPVILSKETIYLHKQESNLLNEHIKNILSKNTEFNVIEKNNSNNNYTLISTSTIAEENALNLRTPLENYNQLGFQAGVLSSINGKKIAFIAGDRDAKNLEFFCGFVYGVIYGNKEYGKECEIVQVIFQGNDFDYESGVAIGNSMLDQGIDFIFSIGYDLTKGIIDATVKREIKNIWVGGFNLDFYPMGKKENGKSVVLFSGVIDYTNIINNFIKNDTTKNTAYFSLDNPALSKNSFEIYDNIRNQTNANTIKIPKNKEELYKIFQDNNLEPWNQVKYFFDNY